MERKADVRRYLEELAKRDNFCLKGLQLDILRNEGHDLHKEEVWTWVSQQLQSGVVDLFLVAPPCNTHSRARCQYRQHGGPRPLRDYNFPHGFPWLSEENKQKVQLADELIRKSLQGCQIVHERGGHFFLEHPEQLGLTAGQIPVCLKWLNCCVKRGSAHLQSFSVSFPRHPLNLRVSSRRSTLSANPATSKTARAVSESRGRQTHTHETSRTRETREDLRISRVYFARSFRRPLAVYQDGGPRDEIPFCS